MSESNQPDEPETDCWEPNDDEETFHSMDDWEDLDDEDDASFDDNGGDNKENDDNNEENDNNNNNNISEHQSADNEEEHYFSSNEQRLLILLIELGYEPSDNLEIYFMNDDITNAKIDILLNSDDMYRDYIDETGYTAFGDKRRNKWEEVAKFLKRRFRFYKLSKLENDKARDNALTDYKRKYNTNIVPWFYAILYQLKIESLDHNIDSVLIWDINDNTDNNNNDTANDDGTASENHNEEDDWGSYFGKKHEPEEPSLDNENGNNDDENVSEGHVARRRRKKRKMDVKKSRDRDRDYNGNNGNCNDNVANRSYLSKEEEDVVMLIIEGYGFVPYIIAKLLKHDSPRRVEKFYNEKMKSKEFRCQIQRINEFRWCLTEAQLIDLLRRFITKLKILYDKMDIDSDSPFAKDILNLAKVEEYCKNQISKQHRDKNKDKDKDKENKTDNCDHDTENKKEKKKETQKTNNNNGISFAFNSQEIKCNQVVSNQSGDNNTQGWSPNFHK